MIQHDIESLIRPTVEDMGCDLWACEYLPQGQYSLLRIYIDKAEGINLSDCESVSRQVSAILDVEDLIAGNYTLEVSSPGIPRPLFTCEHFKLYLGHEVQIKLVKSVAGRRKWVGTILSVQDDAFVLTVGNEQQEFLFSNMVKASLTG